MAVREYIGARYVPKFMGTWSNTTAYEALSIVDDGLGTSYTSKKPVPAGTVLTDTEYWAVTGSMSGAIVSLQNRVSFLENEYANVKFYGAIGDGVTDDTTAFKNAFATGKNIYIPEGTYLISDSIPLKSNTIIFGNGLIYDTYQPTDETGLFNGDHISNVTIDGIRIQGTGSLTTAPEHGSMIRFYDSSDIVIRNVELFNNPKIHCICIETSNHSIVEDCYIHSYTQAGVTGLNTSNDLKVLNNTIIDCTGVTNIQNTYPIMLSGYNYSQSSPYPLPEDLFAIGNYIYNTVPFWEGIDSHGGKKIVISDNIVENCYIGVATVGNQYFPCEDVTVNNNVLIGPDSGTGYNQNNCGIAASFITRGIFNNNIIKGWSKLTMASVKTAVYIADCNYIAFENNLLEDNGDNNNTFVFSLYDTTNAKISENIFVDNDALRAIGLRGGSDHVIVKDNYIRNSGEYCYCTITATAPNDIHLKNNNSDVWNVYGAPQIVPDRYNDITVIKAGKVGDIVLNSAPSSGRPLGWICTTAQTNSDPAVYAALSNIA